MKHNGWIQSGPIKLARYLARPTGRQGPEPAVILSHGFPTNPLDARQSAGTFPELVDRISHELGWVAMTYTARGCGTSEGDFSLQGWVDDLRSSIDHVIEEAAPPGIWIIGSSTSASLALWVAADDERVRGVAGLAPRADFDDWAAHPRKFLEHAREIGAIRTAGFPRALDEWSRELRRFRPLDAAARFAPRPLLILHGDEDDRVPEADSRQVAAAHGSAELRIITGGGHRLRHDPRAVAILLGWLERQRALIDV